jgi:hypothetical protein
MTLLHCLSIIQIEFLVVVAAADEKHMTLPKKIQQISPSKHGENKTETFSTHDYQSKFPPKSHIRPIASNKEKIFRIHPKKGFLTFWTTDFIILTW